MHILLLKVEKNIVLNRWFLINATVLNQKNVSKMTYFVSGGT